MIKYLPLLLLLVSCNPSGDKKDTLYHSLDTNIFCKKYENFNGHDEGYDCYSLTSGKKFKTVYNLTNVVRVK